MNKKEIKPKVVRGGTAIPLGNNTYYMVGRKHEQGGIDIGNNDKTGIEVEGGEIIKTSPKTMKIFSSVPFLNGESPAEKVLKGEDEQSVFNKQENYKKRNRMKDDGSKYKTGGKTSNAKIIGKTVLQILDPTGISSYGDVKDAYIETKEKPSLRNIGNLTFEIIGALPLLGKVTSPIKLTKGVRRISKTTKAINKIGSVNKKVDSIQELVPIVKHAATKAQDVTSKYITNKLYKRANYNAKIGDNIDSVVDIINTTNTVQDFSGLKDIDMKKNRKKYKTGGIKDFLKNNDLTSSDLVGTSANILGSVLSYRSNKRTLNKMKAPQQPISKQAAKLKTKVNITPQIDSVNKNISAYSNKVFENTSTSKTALDAINKARLAGTQQINELYAGKENAETQLINQDRINQQSVANENIDRYNTWRDSTTAFKNQLADLRGENKLGLISGLNSSLQDLLSRREKRRQFNENVEIIGAAHPNVTDAYLKNKGVRSIGG